MNAKFLAVLFVAAASVLLQGCAGTRYTYLSHLETVDDDGAAMSMVQGDSQEVLAVADGFPGWWGYYPGVMSTNTDVVSVQCERKRSPIPFRKPGLIFGGTVCTVTAEQAGEADLLFGNDMAMSESQYDDRLTVTVTGP